MNSKTYQRPTCKGHIYITVVRDEKGKFDYVIASPPAKDSDCGGMVYAIQDLLTWSLRKAEKKEDINQIIKAVTGHFCNGQRPNKFHCKSCSDAFGQVLKKELIKNDEV